MREVTRTSSVGVVSARASWVVVGGLRASRAGKEFTRACVYVDVLGTLGSEGEGNEAFCIELSGSRVSWTGSKAPWGDKLEF